MEADTSQPNSSSPSKKDRDATVEAVNHLIQGKRHLLVQDFSSAVNSLEEACSLLAACYGDMANECGDAYYHYGRALLELSRKESGIFGNSKDESGGEEEEDDDDDEEEDDNENEAESKEEDEEEEESEEESKSSEDSEAKSEDLDESKKADEETVSAEAEVKETPVVTEEVPDNKPGSSGEPSKLSVAAAGVAEKPTSNVDDAQPGPSGEQKPKEDGEEISNLQVAWEVLELAKIIFKRQAADSREFQLRLAQVHSKLGEVAMESENYPQSIEDLEECLSLQLPLLEKDDRQLAETYYQLGLAYTFAHEYDSAINGFQLAVNTINSRIVNLSKIVTINAPPNEQGDDPVFHAKLELEELQELLPELREKIADTMDLKKNTVKVAEELNKDFAPVIEEQKIESTVLSPVKENKPITNIGHLVRKKRKPEESSSTSANGDESSNKRSKADDTPLEKNNSVHVTSSSNAESHINGKSAKEELTVAQADTSSVTCLEG